MYCGTNNMLIQLIKLYDMLKYIKFHPVVWLLLDLFKAFGLIESSQKWDLKKNKILI